MRKKQVLIFGICFLLGLGLFTGTSYLVRANTKSYQDEIDAAKAKKENLEKERQELEQKVEELKLCIR